MCMLDGGQERGTKKAAYFQHGGGRIMVCVAISASGMGDLLEIDGIMDKKVQHHILVRHGVPSGSGFILKDDSDIKHSCN